eukprot:comp18068_c0_seq1/m.18652 comp18068_c0_seq1/g.18652  ORF comp18068_c0_seq1/g.18652 comp18068_c0_seq1/m.18652 type:complete len:415 (-) comp18068_c0_seq1:459-1703(-)
MLLQRNTTILARALITACVSTPTRKSASFLSLFSRRTMVYVSASENGSATGQVPITCDLRSDTITVPCKGMKEAMMAAPVGDDVFGEDPTINELERYVAELAGKEAGLFVATGTMSNQLAIRAKIGALESVVCDARCHIFSYECGGVAYHSQAHMIPVTLPPGHKHLTVETIAPHVLGPDMHHAVTKMILLENTLGGSIFPLAEMQRIKQYAESKGLLVHIDGARLWSACIAANTSLKDYAACADSVSLCLSKTLGAPVGSVLVGTRDHIERARKFRKVVGGGWRQGGILAAAGLYAIKNNFGDVIKDVHDRAKLLGDGLGKMGFKINAGFGGQVDTNMVFADMSEVTQRTGLDWAAVAERLRAEGIMIFGPRRGETAKTRLVLHHQAPRESVVRMLEIIEEMIAQAEAKTATQ